MTAVGDGRVVAGRGGRAPAVVGPLGRQIRWQGTGTGRRGRTAWIAERREVIRLQRGWRKAGEAVGVVLEDVLVVVLPLHDALNYV